MNEFQTALAMAFEAGPADVPELTIDQLDGRLVAGHTHEPVRVTGLCGCQAEQPVAACICRAEQPVVTCFCGVEQPVTACICRAEQPVTACICRVEQPVSTCFCRVEPVPVAG